MNNDDSTFESENNGKLNDINDFITNKLILSTVLFTISMLAMFEWKTAIAITIYLISHELGHLLVMLKLNIEIRRIMFIPFIGANIQTDKRFFSLRKDEVKTAIAGPIAGLLFVIALFAVWIVTDNDFFVILSGLLNIINIFNLLPVGMLDGGRIIRSIVISAIGHKDDGWIFYGASAIISVILVIAGSVNAAYFYLGLIMAYLTIQLNNIEKIELANFEKIKNMTSAQIKASILAYVFLVSISILLMAYIFNAIGGIEGFRPLFAKWLL